MLRVGHISTFPPTRCGIASYSQDLVDHLHQVTSCRFRLCYQPERRDGFEGEFLIPDRTEFTRLAHAVNSANIGVVDLQHEFGIWGGVDGEHITTFLSHCEKPIVSTLHTVHGKSASQVETLKLLCRNSLRLVVLTLSAKKTILELVPECADRIVVITHGIPEIPYLGPASQRDTSEFILKFISPGFFRPDKGIEIIIGAFRALREIGIKFQYKIVGEPQSQFSEQCEYHYKILSLVKEKSLADSIAVITGYPDREELVTHIQEADCGVIGYTDLSHSSSGILPLILACARPVVSTPTDYALATAKATPGIFLTSAATSSAIRDRLINVYKEWAQIRELTPRIYDRTRDWIWPRAAEQYKSVFYEALA